MPAVRCTGNEKGRKDEKKVLTNPSCFCASVHGAPELRAL